MATDERFKIQNPENQKWFKEHKDAVVEVTGVLGYCRNMTKKLEGDELKADIENQKNVLHRKQPNRDERYTFQLKEAKVKVAVKDKPNPMECIINSRRFESAGVEGKCLTIEKNGKKPFMFGVRQPNGRIKQIKLDGKSVLSDQPVTVQFGIFAYNDGEDFSIGADAVVFDKQPELYVPGNAFKETYEKRGWDLEDDDETSGDTTDSSGFESASEEDASTFDDNTTASNEEDGSVWN